MSAQADICREIAAVLREAFAGQPGVEVAVEDACNPAEAVGRGV